MVESIQSQSAQLNPAVAAERFAEQSLAESMGTVFVVDDERDVRDSLKWLIESVRLTVRTFASADDFLEHCDPGMPGCLVLDVRMPGISGLDLQDILRERGYTIPIIVVTGYADVPMVIRAMKNGAMEFLRKPYGDQRMLDVVQQALQVDARNRAGAARCGELQRRLNSLTPREREVLELVVEGLTSGDIADRLGINSKTVETHRTNLKKKMQAANVAALVRLFVEASSPSD